MGERSARLLLDQPGRLFAGKSSTEVQKRPGVGVGFAVGRLPRIAPLQADPALLSSQVSLAQLITSAQVRVQSQGCSLGAALH